MIRPFELADLKTLHRYRQQGIFMDSISTLTWGRRLVPMRAVFSPLTEALGTYTDISQQKRTSTPLIAPGQPQAGGTASPLHLPGARRGRKQAGAGRITRISDQAAGGAQGPQHCGRCR